MNKPLHLQYAEGLRSGDRAMLARAITLTESTNLEHRILAEKILEAVLPFTGKAIRLGITGVPGVGKSTCIEQMGLHYIQQGKSVAVLAIDPTSTRTQGSILGDKTRMTALSANPMAFIRPSPSTGVLGGIGAHTYESMLLCEAAGFEVICIETVGVGQSETDVQKLCDVFILLMLAGAGDELQGMKKGIMEWVDILVVNKADGANITQAETAANVYQQSLHWFPQNLYAWKPRAVCASSINPDGILAVIQTIENFFNHMHENNRLSQKRKAQVVSHFKQLLQHEWMQLFWKNLHTNHDIEQEFLQDDFNPYTALKTEKERWRNQFNL